MLLGAYFGKIPGTPAAGVFGGTKDAAVMVAADTSRSPVMTSDESA
jgi:hypothetical protein